MPYIKKEERELYDNMIDEIYETLAYKDDYSVGEMNYVISKLITKVFQNSKNYKTANDIMGVLECVKQEFYRHQVGPYEEEKIKENGDI